MAAAMALDVVAMVTWGQASLQEPQASKEGDPFYK